MTDWTAGYVSDLSYTHGFYREMMPAHLAFTALGFGKAPGGAARPQRVLELGFGMGDGLVLAAAANPRTIYEGVDFLPQHVAHAQGLADQAGLTNVMLRERSFQELAAAAQEGQHDCDVITLHGILSWVNREAQEAIVEIARKRLKPGGLLYVSYNCMPGWAGFLPMRRLMLDEARRVGGSSDQQARAAMELLDAVAQEGSPFFTLNPGIAGRIQRLREQNLSYIPHEYLNADWHIFHVADVMELFAGAKLSFLASATIAENIDSISAPEAARPRIAAATDPAQRETLRDIAGNKQFRRDIYARGLHTLTARESGLMQNALRFALSRPASTWTTKLKTVIGEADLRAEVYQPLVDALAKGSMTFEAIAALPVFQEHGRGAALQAIAVLVHGEHALPLLAPDLVDRSVGQRYNKAIAERAMLGRFYTHVCAPEAGSGIPTSPTDLLLLAAVLVGATEPATLQTHLLTMVRVTNLLPQREGKELSPDAFPTWAQEQVSTFIGRTLPVWQQLGVC